MTEQEREVLAQCADALRDTAAGVTRNWTENRDRAAAALARAEALLAAEPVASATERCRQCDAPIMDGVCTRVRDAGRDVVRDAAEPVASATEPASACEDHPEGRDGACPSCLWLALRAAHAERDAALARAERLAAELATARRDAMRWCGAALHDLQARCGDDLDELYDELFKLAQSLDERGPAKE